jgi:hypothetical protein
VAREKKENVSQLRERSRIHINEREIKAACIFKNHSWKKGYMGVTNAYLLRKFPKVFTSLSTLQRIMSSLESKGVIYRHLGKLCPLTLYHPRYIFHKDTFKVFTSIKLKALIPFLRFNFGCTDLLKEISGTHSVIYNCRDSFKERWTMHFEDDEPITEAQYTKYGILRPYSEELTRICNATRVCKKKEKKEKDPIGQEFEGVEHDKPSVYNINALMATLNNRCLQSSRSAKDPDNPTCNLIKGILKTNEDPHKEQLTPIQKFYSSLPGAFAYFSKAIDRNKIFVQCLDLFNMNPSLILSKNNPLGYIISLFTKDNVRHVIRREKVNVDRRRTKDYGQLRS